MTTRLDLIQPPGCSARFPILSFALPLLALNEVNREVGAKLMLLFSRAQREVLASECLDYVVSHYDLRTREMVRECLACGAEDAMEIAGDLDAAWKTVNAPEGFADAYLRWLTDHDATHRRCGENRTHQPSVANP